MKKDYKAEQAKAREATKPKPVAGYEHNHLPNRKTRREQAKAKNREAWSEANKQWSQFNKQTTRNIDGQSGETDGRKETN